MLATSRSIHQVSIDSRAHLRRHSQAILFAVLLCGLLIRLPFAPYDYQITNDLLTYRRWASTAQANGLVNIYSTAHPDYPPLVLYVLAGAGWTATQVPSGLNVSEHVLNALIKFPSMLADILTAALIAWRFRSKTFTLAIFVAAAYVFNPAIWYVSAAWGQTDSIYALFLVISVIALEHGAVPPAWLATSLALLTKLQSLAIVPLLVAVTAFKERLRGVTIGLATAVATVFTVLAPWLLAARGGDIVQVYTDLPSEAPRVSVSAYNLWYLLLGGYVHLVNSELAPLGLPLTYQTLGILLFGAYVLLITMFFLRSRAVALSAAALSLGLFVLLTQQHERYLFPVLALLLLASAERPRIVILYLMLSATCFFNLITIAPFTPVLGINLVAVEATTTKIAILKIVSLLAAALNVVALVWVVTMLKQRRSDDSARAV